MFKTNLQDCLKAVIDNRGVTPHKRGTEWQDSGIPVLSANNVKTSGLQKLDEIRYIPEKVYSSWMKIPLERGDIILTSEAPAGELYYWDSDERVVLGQRLYGMKVKDDISAKYLKYYLQSSVGQKAILQQQSGSTVSGISAATFPHILVNLLERNEQDLIANFLYDVDSRIINNSAINTELEKMAKTIYDYWFVQFDFPDENGKPYKSSGGKMIWNEEFKREIPEGWEVKAIGQYFSFVKGRIPTKLSSEKTDEYDTPYLTIEAINTGKTEYCSKHGMTITNGEVIMVMDGAASSEVYVGHSGVLGSTFAKLIITDSRMPNSLLYEIIKKYVDVFKKVNTGSTVPHANKRYISETLVVLPPGQVLEIMASRFNNIIEKIIQIRDENSELTRFRDFLLPLLMNGQVVINE